MYEIFTHTVQRRVNFHGNTGVRQISEMHEDVSGEGTKKEGI